MSRVRPCIAITLAILLLFLGLEVAASPIEWPKSEGGNGHYYEVVRNDRGLNWVGAFWKADSMTVRVYFEDGHRETWPGHLATLETPAEDSWVWDAVVDDPGHTCYLGATRPEEEEAGWVWVAGTIACCTPAPPSGCWPIPLTYADWGVDQPEGGNQIYLEYDDTGSGTWKDISQEDIAWWFVVEYEPHGTWRDPENWCLIAVEESSWSTIKALYRDATR